MPGLLKVTTAPAMDAVAGSLDEYDQVPGELDVGGVRTIVLFAAKVEVIELHGLTAGAVPVIVTCIVTVALA